MGNSRKILINNFNLSKDKFNFFSILTTSQKAILLEAASKKDTEFILKKIKEDEIISILKFMDPDEVADIIPLLDERSKTRILNKLNLNLKQKVDFLLKFAPNTAAGIMSLNYIIVLINTSSLEILDRIKKHINSGKKEPTILVVDEKGIFLGELMISSLLFEKKNTLYSTLKKPPTVIYNESQKDCIDVFKKNRHEKVVVLDENESILGIIHSRDIFKVIEDENTQDFYAIAGLKSDEDITDSAFQKVKFRIGWLILNLATAFLAASVVSFFQDTISKLVLLAVFMPIIAGMGGNAGTQTTAILVRSLALKKIDSKIAKHILFGEVSAAFINGLIIGLIVTAIAFIFNHSLLFGLVAGISILINLMIAGLFGTIVPLFLKAFGFDPASSSTVFVTTATDVFGFLIFLGLATLILI